MTKFVNHFTAVFPIFFSKKSFKAYEKAVGFSIKSFFLSKVFKVANKYNAFKKTVDF